MPLRQGLDEIQKSIDRAKSSSSQQNSRWVSWKDGDKKTIRFLLDANEMFTVWVHEYIETPQGKRNFICRSEFGAECPLCASKDPKMSYKREMGYSLAVVREPVLEEGRVAGFRDVQEEIEGKKVPLVGIVCQAPGNFWSYVSAIHQKYGSLLGYDIEIQRKGGGTDTTYPMFPEPPVDIKDIKDRYKDQMIDLQAYLENIGSVEYYTKTLGTGPSVQEETRSSSTPLITGDTEFDRLRASLENG